MKQNCWEFKKCGREYEGAKAKELGVCPASTEVAADEIHDGKNGGRCCWVIVETFCEENECERNEQTAFARKVRNCMNCEFYKLVQKEEDEEE